MPSKGDGSPVAISTLHVSFGAHVLKLGTDPDLTVALTSRKAPHVEGTQPTADTLQSALNGKKMAKLPIS